MASSAKWSGKVHTVSTYPPGRTCSRRIQRPLLAPLASKKVLAKRSRLRNEKVLSFSSINRAGKTLSASRRAKLEESEDAVSLTASKKRAMLRNAKPHD